MIRLIYKRMIVENSMKRLFATSHKRPAVDFKSTALWRTNKYHNYVNGLTIVGSGLGIAGLIYTYQLFTAKERKPVIPLGSGDITLSDEQLQSLFDNIFPKVLVGVFSMATVFISGALAWKRSRSAWFKRDFTDRVNISLNILDNNQFPKIRTLQEVKLSALIDNPAAVKLVSEAAAKTTTENPFLILPKDDAWYVNNCVLNHISSFSKMGYIYEDLNLPVKTTTYVFGLTCERAAGVRTHKIRVFLVKESTLKKLADKVIAHEHSNINNKNLSPEHPFHLTRLPALYKMSKIYLEESGGRGPILERVNLSFPIFNSNMNTNNNSNNNNTNNNINNNNPSPLPSSSSSSSSTTTTTT